jgi:archaellum component FlaC
VTSVLEAVLNELPDENAADARAVVETLEALGHDAARRALFQAMESRAGPVGAQARDALVRSGYYEQVRATDTRTRATEHASASETARDDRRDAEERRRDERYEYKGLEATLREEVFESDQALRRGLEAVIERRIDSVDTLVELYETDRRVEMLIDRASAQHSELGAYLDRIPLGEDVRNGIEEELRTIEKELDHLERLAEGDAERARALQRRLDRLETESETVAPSTPDDESLAAEHRAKLRAQERESIERLRDRYRTAASDRADRVAELRTAFERKRSRFGDGSADPGGSVTDIQAAIERIESQAGRIESLTRRREQEWDRVVEAMNEYDQEVEAAIESLRETAAELERVSSRIDDLTEEISDLRLAQQHQSQRSKEQRETFREVEPRARGDARHQAEMATERAEFYEHRHVYAEFIRRHYEMQLDVVGDRQFRERHGDDIDRIEAELDRYLE